MNDTPRDPSHDDSTHAHLGLWDAISIIVGIVVGTAIFKTPQFVFANVHGPWQGMGCWVLGGVLALIGSLCYAELATTYPRSGGDYVYLTRAYGRWVGFLFGWAQLTVILTGSIGAMAYAFSDYAVAFWQLDEVTVTYRITHGETAGATIVSVIDDAGTPQDTSDDMEPTFLTGDIDDDGQLDADETWTYEVRSNLYRLQNKPDEPSVTVGTSESGGEGIEVSRASNLDAVAAAMPYWTVWLALGPVLVLTILNLLGVVFGKAIQNLLSVVKILGLVAIMVAGFTWGGEASLKVESPMTAAGFGLAMVFVLYAYGGWNDAAFVAAEVRHRNRNMPLALILGTAGITLVYVLVNLAYLWGLGFEGVRTSFAPAADVAKLAMGPWGAKGISVLVMLCALGAINGLIFTGSRIYVSMGADHRLFGWLGRWNARRTAPLRSLLAQTVFTVLLVVTVGTVTGQKLVDAALALVWLNPLPWEKYYGGFNTLVAATSPVFWGFFLLTGFSLFILRAKDHDIKRPFSAPLYPLEPILFCGMCYFMLFSAIDYAGGLSLLGLVPVAIGLPLYWISCLAGRRDGGEEVGDES